MTRAVVVACMDGLVARNYVKCGSDSGRLGSGGGHCGDGTCNKKIVTNSNKNNKQQVMAVVFRQDVLVYAAVVKRTVDESQLFC